VGWDGQLFDMLSFQLYKNAVAVTLHRRREQLPLAV
jgi:hypothetical protein